MFLFKLIKIFCFEKFSIIRKMSRVEKTIFITSALPYVNNIPHLGNIIGSTLSGDVISRYFREKGKRVIYLCGTDEHGSTTTVRAKKENLSPNILCENYRQEHEKIYDWFNINFDAWGRTSTETHSELVCEIFSNLYKNGFIEEIAEERIYCEACNLFLADRYVKGTCYICQNESNGDQCDNCNSLINANKLIAPKCSICSQEPVLKDTKNLYLSLTKIKETIEEYHKTCKWTKNAASIVKTWLNSKEGLKSRCITRDCDWGVKVPLKGYEQKSFYVWFEAPIGYFSILKANGFECKPDFEWISFQGKDNVFFHTILFPATIIGSEKKLPLINKISATEYLLFENKKFSKSNGIGINGKQVIKLSEKLGFNEDYWRFYLLKIRPETSDSSFSLKDFLWSTRKDLVGNIGNFINRCVCLTNKFCNGTTKFVSFENIPSRFSNIFEQYENFMTNLKIRKAVQSCLDIGNQCHNLLGTEEPWFLFKTDYEKAFDVLSLCNSILYFLLKALKPFIPSTVEKLESCISIGKNHISFSAAFEKPFKMIKDQEIKQCIEDF